MKVVLRVITASQDVTTEGEGPSFKAAFARAFVAMGRIADLWDSARHTPAYGDDGLTDAERAVYAERFRAVANAPVSPEAIAATRALAPVRLRKAGPSQSSQGSCDP